MVATKTKIIFNVATSKTQVKRTKPRLQSGYAVQGLVRQSSFDKLEAYAPENCDKELSKIRTNALHRSFNNSLGSISETPVDVDVDFCSQTNKRSKPRSQSGQVVSDIIRCQESRKRILELVMIRDLDIMRNKKRKTMMSSLQRRTKTRLQSGAAVANVTCQDMDIVKMQITIWDRDLMRCQSLKITKVRSE